MAKFCDQLMLNKNHIFKYFFCTIWLAFNVYIFCEAYKKYCHEPEYYFLNKILGNALCISRGTAIIINYTVAIVMIPVSRTANQLFHKIFHRFFFCWFTFYLEKIKVIHITIAIFLVLVSIVHTAAHVFNAYNFIHHYDPYHKDLNWARSPDESIFYLIFATPTGFSGCAMLILLFVIWLSATRRIRDKFYNFFWTVHHLHLVFLGLMYFHPVSDVLKYQRNVESYEPGCELNLDRTDNINISNLSCSGAPVFSAGIKYYWIWPSIALAIFFIDGTIHYFNGNRFSVTVQEIYPLPGQAVYLRLKFIKAGFDLKPGQFILLQCLDISALEWHPFTVVQCPLPNEQHFDVIISVRGDWTKNLYGRVANGCIKKSKGRYKCLSAIDLKFAVDGPFHSTMEHQLYSNILVFIAAGAGITPFAGVVNHLIFSNPKLPSRIHLVWMSKQVEKFSWLSRKLCLLYDIYWMQNKPDRLDIQLYSTNGFENKNLSELFQQDFTFIKARLHKGRPNWTAFFNNLQFLYEKNNVTIFCCGPKSLTTDVRTFCNEFNFAGYEYTFLHEGFN